MGMEPGLVGATVTCLIAQRLARTICPDCRETYKPEAAELEALGRRGERGVELARGVGCNACGGTGFRGRVALFEVLPMTEEIRVLASEHASTTQIQSAAVAGGMRTLREDGIRLCLEGVTTADEVQRVAGDWNA